MMIMKKAKNDSPHKMLQSPSLVCSGEHPVASSFECIPSPHELQALDPFLAENVYGGHGTHMIVKFPAAVVVLEKLVPGGQSSPSCCWALTPDVAKGTMMKQQIIATAATMRANGGTIVWGLGIFFKRVCVNGDSNAEDF